MSTKKYFCIDGNKSIVFLTEDDAAGYDMDMNPELHSTADESMDRIMKHVYAASWEELSPIQQNYLSDLNSAHQFRNSLNDSLDCND